MSVGGGLSARVVRVLLLAGALIAVGALVGAAGRSGTDRAAARAAAPVKCGAEPMEIKDLTVAQRPARPGQRRAAPLTQGQALRRYLPAAGVRMPPDEFVRYPGSRKFFVHKAGGRIRATAELETIGASWYVRTITACDRDMA